MRSPLSVRICIVCLHTHTAEMVQLEKIVMALSATFVVMLCLMYIVSLYLRGSKNDDRWRVIVDVLYVTLNLTSLNVCLSVCLSFTVSRMPMRANCRQLAVFASRFVEVRFSPYDDCRSTVDLV